MEKIISILAWITPLLKKESLKNRLQVGVSPVRWLCLWPLHISPKGSCFCGLMLLGVNFNKVLNLPGQVAPAICHGLGDFNWFSQSWKLQVCHQGWKLCPQLTDGHFLLVFCMAIFSFSGRSWGFILLSGCQSHLVRSLLLQLHLALIPTEKPFLSKQLS